MITDGQGINTLKATECYTGSPAIYQSFPVQHGVSTNSYSNTSGYDPVQMWSIFDYAKSGPTDSAAAATAMYTGQKTYDGRISWSPTGVPLTTIAEIADMQGKATGAVTTVEISHATPAAVWAHDSSRNNYATIAQEMIYTSGLDVIMGAGHPEYNNNGQPSVVDWIETDSGWDETLLIVTADHETGYLWGPGSGLTSTFNQVVNNGAASLPGATYYSGSHSNSLVPLFSKGLGSELFAGYDTGADTQLSAWWGLPSDTYIDNTNIFDVMNSVMFDQIPGDANIDGVVDDADAALLAANWLTMSGANWFDGDFNKDGKVNEQDASILAANWQATVDQSTSVPEPHMLVLLAGIFSILLLPIHAELIHSSNSNGSKPFRRE